MTINNLILIDTKAIAISDEIAEMRKTYNRQDANQKRYARRRKIKSIDEMGEYGKEIIDMRQNVEKAVEQKLEIEALENAIIRLSEGQQALIRLIYFEDLTPSEVARRQGKHRSSICRQLDTIHKILRELLII